MWLALTALAVAIVVGVAGLVFWGVAWMVSRLSSVLLPLAIAGILACLLDPVVDWVERRLRIPRARAILLVFFLGVMLVLLLLMTVVPQLVVEMARLAQELPGLADKLRSGLSEALAKSMLGKQAKAVWDSQAGAEAQAWLARSLPVVSAWALHQATRVASWAGLLIGLAMIPVYVFYFLLEKTGIQHNWTRYLPLGESRLKEELVFCLSAINECLVAFFRGQVLVALCSGTLLTLGFLVLGLPYALLLGLVAATLGIVPYLGVISSLIPALTLAVIQFGDWWHPALVLAVFVLVQTIEGLVVSPRIMGQRVGLHPLTIIVAVMAGTTLLGGLLGGLLAIPLTAALRALMQRYVWRRPGVAAPESGPGA